MSAGSMSPALAVSAEAYVMKSFLDGRLGAAVDSVVDRLSQRREETGSPTNLDAVLRMVAPTG